MSENIRGEIAKVLCDVVADTYSKDRDFSWEQIGTNERNWFIAVADQILSCLKSQIERMGKELDCPDCLCPEECYECYIYEGYRKAKQDILALFSKGG